MADFDEYEYIEKQLEHKENGGQTSSSRSKDRTHRERRSDTSRSGRRRRDRSHTPSKSKRSRHRRRKSPTPPKRERTPPEVRAARERERELRELEKDTRTIFAYNLNLKADERDLFDFFSNAGKVTDVKIIMDRNTRKSKGFAYIEFDKQEDVLNALTLTGQLLLGQAVMVKASEAEKNLAWEAQQQQQQNQAAAAALLGSNLTASGPCKLYVAGLHPDITQNDLKRIFSPFGDVDLVQLALDSKGTSQGYGYVQFSRMQDATKAMQQLNGLEIGGSAIRVQIASVAAGDVGAITYGELDEEDGKSVLIIQDPRSPFLVISHKLQSMQFIHSIPYRSWFGYLLVIVS
eukprot:g7653.t1